MNLKHPDEFGAHNKREQYSLGSMGGGEYAHRVEVDFHHLAEIRGVRDGLRELCQAVSEVHVVAVLGLRRVRRLRLHSGCRGSGGRG